MVLLNFPKGIKLILAFPTFHQNKYFRYILAASCIIDVAHYGNRVTGNLIYKLLPVFFYLFDKLTISMTSRIGLSYPFVAAFIMANPNSFKVETYFGKILRKTG